MKKESMKERRKRLFEVGEPCGAPLEQCPNNSTIHMEYFNLPDKEKYRMMKEREKRYK